MSDLQRVNLNAARPHHWQDCYPIVVDPDGNVDLDDTRNRVVRQVFHRLGQFDRIKFHQASCQNRISPQHDAVITKISARLEEALRLAEMQELVAKPAPRTD